MKNKILIKDRKYLGREGSARLLQVVKADGSYLYDQDGNRYIDFFTGWCVGNIGWDVKDVVKEGKAF